MEEQASPSRSSYIEIPAQETAEAETEPMATDEPAKPPEAPPTIVRIRYPKLPAHMNKGILEIIKKGDLDALKLEQQQLLP